MYIWLVQQLDETTIQNAYIWCGNTQVSTPENAQWMTEQFC